MDAKEAVSVTHADTINENMKTSKVDPVGTVRLIDHNEVVLIPTPSPDPRGRILPRSGNFHAPSYGNQIH
jgi:hypothetical protein